MNRGRRKSLAKRNGVCMVQTQNEKRYFHKGQFYIIKNNPARTDNELSVFVGGLPICDLGSQFFKSNFEYVHKSRN